MIIDVIEIADVISGLGGFFLKNRIAARISDNEPAPMASTTATELIKIDPS